MMVLAFASCQKNNDAQEEQKQDQKEEELIQYLLLWQTDGKNIARQVLMNASNYDHCDIVINEYDDKWFYMGRHYIENAKGFETYILNATHKKSYYATVAVKLYIDYGHGAITHLQFYVNDTYLLKHCVDVYGNATFVSEDPAYKKR